MLKKYGIAVRVRFDEPCYECGEPMARSQFEAGEIEVAPFGGSAHSACVPFVAELRTELSREFSRLVDEARLGGGR